MDSEYNSDMLKKLSYRFVFGFPENAGYLVQKMISNFEHFKDFWRAYPNLNSCRRQSCIVKWQIHSAILIISLKLILRYLGQNFQILLK